MKKIIITAAVSIFLGLGTGWFFFHSSKNETSNERKILYYRDPMNPQLTSPAPKKASDGMDFVPVYADASAQTGQKKVAYYKDPMHPWYTSDKPGKAPDCGMDLVPVYEGESDSSAIHIDPVTMQNMGVTTEEAKTRSLTKTIRATGKIDYDETKIYSVSTKVMGYVEHLYVDYTGQTVRKGQVLMDLYSPELVATQQEYLQAIHYQKQLQNSSIEEARKEAEELVQSSRQRLLYWDIPESEIKALEERGIPKKTMTIVSPVDGVVTDKMVTQGQNVMSGMTLYKIADVSSVWILADIYQYELSWVKLGQKADIDISYAPGKTIAGVVDYIYPYLNMETKTATVRIKVRNFAGVEFKPEMYATINLFSPPEIKNVTVPDRAIIRSGERNILVVALGGGYFAPRDVKLGVEADGYVEILEGIKDGEQIVTSSQFLIDSESNLKAAVSSMLSHTKSDSAKPTGQSTPAVQSTTKAKNDGTPDKNGDHGKPGTWNAGHKISHEVTHNEKLRSSPVQPLIDPVCGMEADGSEALSYFYNGKKYFFCGSDDMEKFKRAPQQYIPLGTR
jgi:membrane fusion protein, copper/silver efflux system